MADAESRPRRRSPIGSRPRSGRSVIAVRGVFWSGATIIGPLVVSALVFVLTSRSLSPSDFGLVALAGTVAAGVACLIPGGFGDALVQQDVVEAPTSTVFWLCTGSGRSPGSRFSPLRILPLASFTHPCSRPYFLWRAPGSSPTRQVSFRSRWSRGPCRSTSSPSARSSPASYRRYLRSLSWSLALGFGR